MGSPCTARCLARRRRSVHRCVLPSHSSYFLFRSFGTCQTLLCCLRCKREHPESPTKELPFYAFIPTMKSPVS